MIAHRERNIPEIFSMYEVTFAKLSERFFKGTTWPPVEDIAELVDKDSVFCLLYKVGHARRHRLDGCRMHSLCDALVHSAIGRSGRGMPELALSVYVQWQACVSHAAQLEGKSLNSMQHVSKFIMPACALR